MTEEQPALGADLRRLLACPACRGALDWSAAAIRCTACGATYRLLDGIPVLVVESGFEPAKRRQAEHFDQAVDPEFEIRRPASGPRLYDWLLSERFRRGVASIAGELPGTLVLTVCGGSGMDAELLARAGATVISSDLSEGAAQRAGERARRSGLPIAAVVADVEHLPFADRSVPIVYVHDGLHHLDDPLDGLREMARVAARAVVVNEPARAAITAAAVRLGLALEREDAGNVVSRIRPEDVVRELEDEGFAVVRARRFGMYYRHAPGSIMRLLSQPALFAVVRLAFRAANAVGAGLGNKFTVQAVRR
jgi:SAM-dependent methyltransferase